MKKKSKIEANIATYYKRRERYKKVLKNCNKNLHNLKRQLKYHKCQEEHFLSTLKKLKNFWGESVKTTEDSTTLNISIYYCSQLYPSSYMCEYLKKDRSFIYNRVKRGNILIKTTKKELWGGLKNALKM